jgi:hypothetical protein
MLDPFDVMLRDGTGVRLFGRGDFRHGQTGGDRQILKAISLGKTSIP